MLIFSCISCFGLGHRNPVHLCTDTSYAYTAPLSSESGSYQYKQVFNYIVRVGGVTGGWQERSDGSRHQTRVQGNVEVKCRTGIAKRWKGTPTSIPIGALSDGGFTRLEELPPLYVRAEKQLRMQHTSWSVGSWQGGEEVSGRYGILQSGLQVFVGGGSGGRIIMYIVRVLKGEGVRTPQGLWWPARFPPGVTSSHHIHSINE